MPGWNNWDSHDILNEEISDINDDIFNDVPTTHNVCAAYYVTYSPTCPKPSTQEMKAIKNEVKQYNIYLDTNASHPVEPDVISFMSEIASIPGNASSNHFAGRKARTLIEEARAKIADYLGVHSENIVFTSGGTECNNMIIHGIECDRVAISAIEHKSVLNSAHAYAPHTEVIPVDENGKINCNRLAEVASDGRTLVSIIHANNETGVLQDVDEIYDSVSGKDVFLHMDMSQTLGKVFDLPNLYKLDAATFSAHKFGGPVGVGILYIRDPKAIAYRLLYGGHQENDLRPGTYNHVGIAGAGKAIELLDSMNIKDISNMRMRLEDKLSSMGCKIQPKNTPRIVNTISAIVPGSDSANIINKLSQIGIYISASSACTSHEKTPSHVLKAMGLSDDDAQSTLRISINRHTTEDEVTVFTDMLRKHIKGAKNV